MKRRDGRLEFASFVAGPGLGIQIEKSRSGRSERPLRTGT
jgi:hypothetical protein